MAEEENKVPKNETSNDIEISSLSYNDFFIQNEHTTFDTSMSQLKQYIKYPMLYNEILRKISLQAYSLNGQYGQTIDRLVSLPNLDSITVLRNKTVENKKKKPKFNILLKIINHKRTARDILRHLLIDGMYVGILRDTKAENKNLKLDNIDIIDKIEGLSLNDNFMIQPLDLDYCKIVGYQNGANIAAFDMSYFDQFKNNGLIAEIKNYPKEFVIAYKKYRNNHSNKWFILDYKKTIASKSRSSESEPYGRPFGLSALLDIKADDDYKDSQYKLINEIASSIYYMILPPGKEPGTCALNDKQQAAQTEAFRNAVKINTSTNTSKISTLTLAPGGKIDRLVKDSSLIKDTLSDENIKKISTSLGFASSALNASADGGSSYANLAVNIDLILAQIFNLTEGIGSEITRVLNHHIGNKPKDFIELKYLKTSMLNQDKMYDKAKDLYTLGSGSLKYWIACAGFDVDDYMSILDEELDEGIYEKYLPHTSIYTNNGEDKNDSGRPNKNERDLSPNGKITKDTKSNEKRKAVE